MRITLAAVQRPSVLFRRAENLEAADAQLGGAVGADLVVFPELMDTGYARRREYVAQAEGPEGMTARWLLDRARRYHLAIAAGFAERHDGHVYNAIGFATACGQWHVYRKRNLVFWEPTQFRRGRAPLIVTAPFGRIGFAICADMLYRRVWADYRDRIDLAVISSAWPSFADAGTGRPHWLLGRLGPLCGQIPARVSADLGVPVAFANQCGPTETVVPVTMQRFPDRFAGRSAICDVSHGVELIADRDSEQVLISSVTVHPPRGPRTWVTMSRSGFAVGSSASAR